MKYSRVRVNVENTFIIVQLINFCSSRFESRSALCDFEELNRKKFKIGERERSQFSQRFQSNSKLLRIRSANEGDTQKMQMVFHPNEWGTWLSYIAKVI